MSTYDNKFENLDKIYKFLERQNEPKLTEKEIDTLNSTICQRNLLSN